LSRLLWSTYPRGGNATARAVPDCDLSGLVRGAHAACAARPVGICNRRWHKRFSAMGLEVISRLSQRDVYRWHSLGYAMVEARHALGGRFPRYDVCRLEDRCRLCPRAFLW